MTFELLQLQARHHATLTPTLREDSLQSSLKLINFAVRVVPPAGTSDRVDTRSEVQLSDEESALLIVCVEESGVCWVADFVTLSLCSTCLSFPKPRALDLGSRDGKNKSLRRRASHLHLAATRPTAM